ncbi:MAG: heavy metal-associated domain-containing protein, partial [bacterium]
MKQTYSVAGMHCASCASIIKRKLTKLPGVTSAEVNLATETAEVNFSKNINVATLNKEISPLGYTIKSTNPPMGQV